MSAALRKMAWRIPGRRLRPRAERLVRGLDRLPGILAAAGGDGRNHVARVGIEVVERAPVAESTHLPAMNWRQSLTSMSVVLMCSSSSFKLPTSRGKTFHVLMPEGISVDGGDEYQKPGISYRPPG